MLIRFISVLLLLTLFNCQTTQAPADSAASADTNNKADRLTIIGINDIYRIEGVANGTRGGLSRIRTLRKSFEEQGDVLVMHGGDALSPAAMSQKFSGANMVDVLNLLDGDADAFDKHMFITFGNHEFDLKDGETLDARVEESQFTWLNTNVVWSQDAEGNPVVEAQNEVPTTLLEVNGRTVGIYSVTINSYPADFIDDFLPYEAVSRRCVKELRANGAELVIGLTHLDAASDKALVEALGAEGPDVVFGGHDHKNMVVVANNGTKIIKADADGVTAQVVHIDFAADGSISVETDLRELDESVAQDPYVQERVAYWEKKYDPTGELAEAVGTTKVELDAEELDIRRFETNLGNWVADQMVKAGNAEKAQVALINSGSLRLNDIILPGSITLGNMAELLPYQTDMVLKELSGADIKRALQFSVSDWSGSGHFLQVSGLRFTHDTAAETAKDIEIKVGDSYVPVEDAKTYRVVLSSYIAAGGDGYDWFKDLKTVKNLGDLKSFLSQQLKAAGAQGIAPQVDGRIQTVYQN